MRASRLISLLMLLQTNGQMTAQALATDLEVSTRTIYRDLDALSAAGVPVYAERGPHGGCALLENYRTTLTGLSAEEARSVFMLMAPKLLGDLGLRQVAETAQRKLAAALPAPFQHDIEQVQQRVHLDAAGWFKPPEPTPYLSLVQQALWGQLKLRIEYRKANGDWVKRLIAPYGLVGKAGMWYLVAYSGRHIWNCRISRIKSAEITTQHFNRPADFDLARYWQVKTKKFETETMRYEVKIQVRSGGWHSLTQMFGEGVHFLEPAGKNHDIITLNFPSADVACLQLLGMPPSVEVLAPAELRYLMHLTALKVTSRYEAASMNQPSAFLGYTT